MTLSTMTPETLEIHDRLCSIVAARGQGLSLRDLGDIRAVAEEAVAGTLGSDRARLCLERLELTEEGVADAS